MTTALLEKIIEGQGKAITFEQFMQKALYDTELGYYTRNIRSVGRSGDFSTSATITPLLGRAIARWLLANKSDAFHGFHWHVIEVGGGNGDLALAILKSLPFWERWRLQYHLVEISPNLHARQQSLLSGYNVRWHNEIHSALKESHGHALIFSNELVDAFPCVILKKNATSFQELSLACMKNEIREIWSDTHDPRLQTDICSVMSAPEKIHDGQRVEIHLSYRDWLQSWMILWKRGHMLTIDYGDIYPDLYYRRPDGTARGYFLHQRIEGLEIYQRLGKQDLTVDVNFSDLIQWGLELGCPHRPLQNQRDFLFEYLPPCDLEEGSPEKDCLMATEGGGTAYKVLWQSRNADQSMLPVFQNESHVTKLSTANVAAKVRNTK